ncbi:MAG: hypothetical protein AAGF77_09675 [Bacteroidota bacterium]
MGILLLLSAIGKVQGQSKNLKGRVIAKGDVTGVTIQNRTTEKATITDLEGYFSIQVRLGDTLVFSAVQLKPKILPVSKAIFSSAFLRVPMERFVNELREVTVMPYGLSGDLASDLTTLPEKKPVDASTLGLPNPGKPHPSQSERLLAEAGGSLWSPSRPLAVSLNPILNAISGRTKMLKNRVKVDKKYARTQRVQRSYSDSIFQTTFLIPKEKIDDFMYFCEVDDAFQQLVEQRDGLKLWAYLEKKSKVYRANNGLE